MNKESAFPAMHYADWLGRHAATRPGIAALVTPDSRFTYAELHRALHAVAHRLVEAGIEPGQTVAICAANQILHCVLILALNRLGCVPVGLTRPLMEGVAIVLPRGVAVDRILVEQPFPGVAPEGCVNVDLDWLKTGKEKVVEWRKSGLPDGNAPAHIFSSSGTTGEPKSMALSTKQLEARFLKRTIGPFSLGLAESLICQFGLRSAPGLVVVLSAWWAGGTVYLGWPDSQIAGLVSRRRVRRIEGSPAQYQGILQRSKPENFDLSSLRFAIVAGSATPPPLARAIQTKICRLLVNHYGSTELGTVAFGGMTAIQGRCGHLVPWVQAETVDDEGNVLPLGEEGNLRFRCEEMVTSFLGDPEASAKYFRGGWFYPGDVGTVSDDRILTLSGRQSERINAGGVKVAPDVVEDVVRQYEGVVECAAFGAKDRMGMEQIWVAIVVDREVNPEEVQKFCAPKLGARTPRRIIVRDSLPRGESGKLQRFKLQEVAAEILAQPPKQPQKTGA
jgi:acyl-coenzyme A synthetase/AMP-(fatty) acid ligase